MPMRVGSTLPPLVRIWLHAVMRALSSSAMVEKVFGADLIAGAGRGGGRSGPWFIMGTILAFSMAPPPPPPPPDVIGCPCAAFEELGGLPLPLGAKPME